MRNKAVDILLVEDNPDDAEMTIRSLKQSSLAGKLIHVKDGAEALDFIFAKGKFAGRDVSDLPAVILLDIKMPKIDGIQVLRKVKSDEATKIIPVVMITSSNQERDIFLSYELGANSYVVKPVDFESFAKAVSDLGIYWLLINQSPLS